MSMKPETNAFLDRVRDIEQATAEDESRVLQAIQSSLHLKPVEGPTTNTNSPVDTSVVGSGSAGSVAAVKVIGGLLLTIAVAVGTFLVRESFNKEPVSVHQVTDRAARGIQTCSSIDDF